MNAIDFLSAQPWANRLGSTLLHFLWQGAVLAAVYALARGRIQSAQRRYVLACAILAAMVAAPVATFFLTGASETTAAFFRTAATPASHAGSPPFDTLPRSTPPPSPTDFMPWLVSAWFAGTLICCIRLLGGYILAARMKSARVHPVSAEWQRAAHRLAVQIRVSAPVRVLVSTLIDVPVVIGWLRPAILLPAAALSGIAPEHLEILLAHELAHIRRQDYAINFLQSAAEALLFYHPAIWWMSSQIRNERELCCDALVVSAGADPLVYADALATLEARRPAHLTPALAASGGSLAERIAHLLGQPRRKSSAPAAIALFVAFAACCVFAQAADTRPAFEVASLKLNNSGTGVDNIKNLNGNLRIVNVSLKRLIGMAYGVAEGRDYLFTGPDWLDSENFDVTAKYPAEAAPEQSMLMLQRLLDERFHLRLHHESREFAVYALLKVKDGPNLKPTIRPGGAYKFSAQPGHATGSAIPMAQLADTLSRPVFQLYRKVVDLTNMPGAFDVTLDWSPEGASQEAAPGPSIYAAVQEQLGLKLEARKLALDVLVVDQANKVPDEN